MTLPARVPCRWEAHRLGGRDLLLQLAWAHLLVLMYNRLGRGEIFPQGVALGFRKSDGLLAPQAQ